MIFNMLFGFLLLTVASGTPAGLNAGCQMRLHKNGTGVGEIRLSSRGAHHTIEVYLKGDPQKLAKGYHGLNIHTNPVQDIDCSMDITGGHFSPSPFSDDHGSIYSSASERHFGDLGNVRVGERGEANLIHQITVDPLTEFLSMSGVIEPVKFCAPKYYLLVDGVRKRQLTEGSMLWARKLEKLSQRFQIEKKEVDCYQPVYNRFEGVVDGPKFMLEGENSVIGRAIVLQLHENGSDEDDMPIACCTLERTG